jgi:hypothetical protein
MRIISLSLTLLALALVPAAFAENGDGASIRGVVTAASEASVTVRDGDRQLTCTIGPDSPAVTGLALGVRVAIACSRGVDGKVLVALKKVEPKVKTLEIEGAVEAVPETSLTVKSRSGRALTCIVPDSLATAAGALAAGDLVKARCTKRPDADPVLAALKRIASKGKPKAAVDIAGRVTALADGSITITGETRTLSCTVPAALAPAVTALSIGAMAAMVCRDGLLLAVKKKDVQPVDGTKESGSDEPSAETPPPTGSSGSTTTIYTFRGAITSISPDRIFVSTEEGPWSCFVSETLRASVAGFAVGAAVKLACTGTEPSRAQLVKIVLVV